MQWIIILCIVAFLFFVFARKKTRGDYSSKAFVESRSSGQGTNFLPPIPKGYRIFNGRLSVAGIEYRRDDAIRFAKSADQALALEREPNNMHDANAIKVIGISHGKHYFIGYVPKEIAEQIVCSGHLMDAVQPRLERIWHTDSGYVNITFQIIGPKDKREQYDDFRNNKPAHPWDKEFLKFFGLSIPKSLTSGQAAKIIVEHRKKLEAEDKSALEEWDAYEEICEQFDDADFRREFELKKVSDKVLKEALEILRKEGNTMRSLAIDIDKVVAKIIELKPDLERE